MNDKKMLEENEKVESPRTIMARLRRMITDMVIWLQVAKQYIFLVKVRSTSLVDELL